jgi:hypothetical protein
MPIAEDALDTIFAIEYNESNKVIHLHGSYFIRQWGQERGDIFV